MVALKLRAALLGCALLIAATRVQAQLPVDLDCDAEDFEDLEDTFAVEDFDDTTTPQTTFGRPDDFRVACETIAKSVSPASHVFFPGTEEFKQDMSHWSNSSSQVSACSVRPGTPQDVGLILRELAAKRTPFAIRCSGHTANPGFSSTRGVQISMIRFSDIVIHEESGTVDVGAGLTWTGVYKHLVPKGLNVVGGRLDGVGLGGFTLGGGYSWKTNQFGLTIDTVTAFELVLPNGKVRVVTEKDKDLWWALKGGLNNYGIVTKFTFKTHKQPKVWGAILGFAGDQVKPAYTAFAKWLEKDHDRKGAQLGAITYGNGTIGFGIVLFYDGPKPPRGLYDDLLKLPHAVKQIIKGDFIQFVMSLPPPVRERAYFDGVPILHYSAPVLKATIDDLQSWGDRLSKEDKDLLLVFNLDAFENDILTHGGPSAYPPDRSHTVLPSSLYFGWTDKSKDKVMYDNMRELSASIIKAGIKDGQDLEHAAHYTNYALYGTPLEQMYGGNVARLQQIRKQYDPRRVMDLTGGFKF